MFGSKLEPNGQITVNIVLYGGTVLYGRTPSFQTDRTCTVLYGVLRYGTVITVKKAEVRHISTSLVSYDCALCLWSCSGAVWLWEKEKDKKGRCSSALPMVQESRNSDHMICMVMAPLNCSMAPTWLSLPLFDLVRMSSSACLAVLCPWTLIPKNMQTRRSNVCLFKYWWLLACQRCDKRYDNWKWRAWCTCQNILSQLPNINLPFHDHCCMYEQHRRSLPLKLLSTPQLHSALSREISALAQTKTARSV